MKTLVEKSFKKYWIRNALDDTKDHIFFLFYEEGQDSSVDDDDIKDDENIQYTDNIDENLMTLMTFEA